MEQSNPHLVSTTNHGNTQGAVCSDIRPQATDSQNASTSGVSNLPTSSKKRRKNNRNNKRRKKTLKAVRRYIPTWDSSSGKPRILNDAESQALHLAFTKSIKRIRARLVSDFSEVPTQPIGVTDIYWKHFVRRYGLRFEGRKYSFYNHRWIPLNIIDDASNDIEDACTVDPKSLLLPLNLRQRNLKCYRLGREKPLGTDPDPLWFVIFAPEGYPEKVLSDEEIVQVYNRLWSLLLEKSKCITSENVKYKSANGSLLVLCDCESYRDLVCGQLEQINRLECYSLRLLHSNELPNTVRMVSTFEAPVVVKKEIVAKLLMVQNSSLDTTNWQFYQVRDNRYIVDMDVVSAEVISKWRYSLFYGLGKITISVGEEGVIRREISEMNPKELEDLNNEIMLEKQGGSHIINACLSDMSDDEDDSKDDEN